MRSNNVYCNPEAFELKLIGEVDLSEPNYSFDILAVWKGESGYYLATDSGCSCPSPFENYDAVDDLTGPLTAEQAKEEATSLWIGSLGEPYDLEGFRAFLESIV